MTTRSTYPRATGCPTFLTPVISAIERNGRYVARYPNARYLLGRADWEGNPERNHPEPDHIARLGAIDHLGKLDLVEGDLEVCPGVTMIHTPGESPGHSIVRVSS